MISAIASAVALAASLNVVGNWQYDGFYYQEHRYENPNSNLVLVFTFNADGTERLFWSRTDEKGFCERKGTYTIEGDKLIQQTTWLNPDNDSSCSSDPDMQPNRTTETVIDMNDGNLNIHMDLNGAPFLYILKSVSSAPPTPQPNSFYPF
jgi:hypothetical protein